MNREAGADRDRLSGLNLYGFISVSFNIIICRIVAQLNAILHGHYAGFAPEGGCFLRIICEVKENTDYRRIARPAIHHLTASDTDVKVLIVNALCGESCNEFITAARFNGILISRTSLQIAGVKGHGNAIAIIALSHSEFDDAAIGPEIVFFDTADGFSGQNIPAVVSVLRRILPIGGVGAHQLIAVLISAGIAFEGLEHIPRGKELNAEYAQIQAQRSELRSELQAARKKSREYELAKENIRMFFEQDTRREEERMRGQQR